MKHGSWGGGMRKIWHNWHAYNST